MYLLLSNILTILMLFEDSLFVYPLGNDFDKLRGTQFEKFSFGIPTRMLTHYFISLDFTNFYKRI